MFGGLKEFHWSTIPAKQTNTKTYMINGKPTDTAKKTFETRFPCRQPAGLLMISLKARAAEAPSTGSVVNAICNTSENEIGAKRKIKKLPQNTKRCPKTKSDATQDLSFPYLTSAPSDSS